MSTFFKALERAEQERALRDAPAPASAPTSPISSVATPNAAPTIPSIESVFTRPKPTAAPLERVSGRADEGSQIEEHLVSLLSPTSFEAEQYRALRHLIEQRQASATLSVIALSLIHI